MAIGSSLVNKEGFGPRGSGFGPFDKRALAFDRRRPAGLEIAWS